MAIMAKTKEQIEEVRRRMLKDPQRANFAKTMINPHTPEGKEKIKRFQQAGVEAARAARAAKRERDERIKAKAAEMSETLEAIKAVSQDPLDVMRLLMHEAMADGDRDEAFKIAKELGEYKAPKKTRVESVNTDRAAADLSLEELSELAQLKKDLGE
jgi:hypothetical protein